MNAFDDMISFFSPGQPTTGVPLSNPPPQSGFFDKLLSGAIRGAEQGATTSDFGTKLQGWLTQGQAQVAAQNLFGNPIILIAVLGGLVFAGVLLLRK